MSQYKELDNLPYIDLTVRLYETSETYQSDEDGTKYYFATFRYGGYDVIINDESVGSVNPGIEGGLYVRVDNREFYLPPDDIWHLIQEKIGFILPEESNISSEEESDKEVEAIEEETENINDVSKDEIGQGEEIYNENLMIFPVDYDADFSGIYGGNLKDIPEPRYWYWPNGKQEREVTMKIMSYAGSGGKHYYIDITEQQNYIWDGKENEYKPGIPNGWIRLWERGKETGEGLKEFDFYDESKDYIQLHNVSHPKDSAFRFDFYTDAKGFCLYIYEKYFSNHKLIWEDYTPEYYYEHQGD